MNNSGGSAAGTGEKPFALDPRLAADSVAVAELALTSVRLMRDASYPWLLLIPRRTGLVEITDLGRHDQFRLMDEIALVSTALREAAPCDKLNVAAIGNIVRQLHVHIVARSVGDAAWPRPVWGHAPAKPYKPEAEKALAAAIAARLSAGRETG